MRIIVEKKINHFKHPCTKQQINVKWIKRKEILISSHFPFVIFASRSLQLFGNSFVFFLYFFFQSSLILCWNRMGEKEANTCFDLNWPILAICIICCSNDVDDDDTSSPFCTHFKYSIQTVIRFTSAIFSVRISFQTLEWCASFEPFSCCFCHFSASGISIKF